MEYQYLVLVEEAYGEGWHDEGAYTSRDKAVEEAWELWRSGGYSNVIVTETLLDCREEEEPDLDE